MDQDQNQDRNKLEEIKDYESQIEVLKNKIKVLRDSCDHKLNFNSTCTLCSKDFYGWYCKHSPDNLCHYYAHSSKDDDKKYVYLYGNSSNKSFLSEEIMVNIEKWGYSEDWCIFCGEPEERK